MPPKVLVNPANGPEDAERVMIAFLVATAALEQGKLIPTIYASPLCRPRGRCPAGLAVTGARGNGFAPKRPAQ